MPGICTEKISQVPRDCKPQEAQSGTPFSIPDFRLDTGPAMEGSQQGLVVSHCQYVRAADSVRAMKPSPVTIKIEQAGQVNVGEKQLNVSGGS